MSNLDQPNDPAPPEGTRSTASTTASAGPAAPMPGPTRARSTPTPHAPRPRGGGTLALALLLALAAAGVAGYVGWQQWQSQQSRAADSHSVASLQTRVGALETSLNAVSGERASLSQRLGDAAQVNRSLREELLAQAERTRHVEDAVAKLAEKTLSGHDASLLDETASLLRMADERYTLFHDAQGAAAAYALADQTLAAVNDTAFSGLRQTISSERDALARSQPTSQIGALQQLLTLRGALATLPLKPLDQPATTATADVWTRMGHALAGVISVKRDNGAPLAVADARFTRELAVLDLAQAQAALLAYDSKAYAAALQRVEVSLSTQFDGNAAAVQKAQAQLKQLRAALPTSEPVELGAALTELQNLRTVHALSPASDSSAPASASSAAVPAAGIKP
ncbi:MAG: uroporphyrinogen-III C-methyltransferase [Rhodanobacter sp.]